MSMALVARKLQTKFEKKGQNRGYCILIGRNFVNAIGVIVSYVYLTVVKSYGLV